MESCAYCGEMATCLDHVIPRAFQGRPLKRSKTSGHEPGLRVPTCTQCNGILGSRIFNNLVERKAFVHNRLSVKLRKYNASIGWGEDEIESLGRCIQSSIEIAMAKRSIARDRLIYSAGPPESHWIRLEEKWRDKMAIDPTLPQSSIRSVI